MDIKTEAIKKAIRMLDAVKAQYKIISEDGQEFGKLEVAAAKPKRSLRHRFFAQTGYLEKITNMAVGDVVFLSPPTDATCEQMRSAVCGSLNRKYGGGSCMTTINKSQNQIEVLRMS
jgi:hypothetical protein